MTVTLIVWDGVRKTAAFCKSLARSQHPQNGLYHVITNHYKDPLAPGRLHFFLFSLQVFLKGSWLFSRLTMCDSFY